MLLTRVDLVHVYGGQGVEEGRGGLLEVDPVESSIPSALRLVPLELHIALYV